MSAPDPRLLHNNFDLLRLLLALTVCLVHAQELSREPALAWIGTFLSSLLAVKAFFVISGFLILMSYERSRSLANYGNKRLRRIYPAYLLMIVGSAVLLAAVSSLPAAAYFNADWLRYLVANLLFLNFLQPTLPGVFELNPLPAVNGALWTLKIEVMFYLSVPVLVGLFRRYGRLRVMLLVYLGALAYQAGCTLLGEQGSALPHAELARQLPGQLGYFIVGALCYYQLDFFARQRYWILALAVLVLVLNPYWPLGALEPLALGALVLFLALFTPVLNIGKYGDFSYGVYILHFPLIQCFIDRGWFAGQSLLFLLAVLCATLGGAVLMWHGVESRFLRRS